MGGGNGSNNNGAPPAVNIANPAPLGLLCFGMTTLTLMYVEMGWCEPEFTVQVAAFAFALGGLGQVFVAVFEILKGSSFSFAVFFCYGAFWLTFAIEYYQKQHLDVNSEGEQIYKHPIGSALYLGQWGVLTFCFWIVTLRKNVLLVGVFMLLWMTFFLLAAASASGNETIKIVGGYFGFFTAVGAFYTGVAELINEEYGRHVLPGLKPLYTPERLVLTPELIESLIIYDKKTNTALYQFRGLQIRTSDDVEAVEAGVRRVLDHASKMQSPSEKRRYFGKVHIMADYNDSFIADDVADQYWQMAKQLEKKYYLSVTRFCVTSMGTGLRSGGTNAVGGGRHKSEEEEAAERTRSIILNQLQSIQAMSRVVTPAASNISDGPDYYSDNPRKTPTHGSPTFQPKAHTSNIGYPLSNDGGDMDFNTMMKDCDDIEKSTEHVLRQEQQRREAAEAAETTTGNGSESTNNTQPLSTHKSVEEQQTEGVIKHEKLKD